MLGSFEATERSLSDGVSVCSCTSYQSSIQILVEEESYHRGQSIKACEDNCTSVRVIGISWCRHQWLFQYLNLMQLSNGDIDFSTSVAKYCAKRRSSKAGAVVDLALPAETASGSFWWSQSQAQIESRIASAIWSCSGWHQAIVEISFWDSFYFGFQTPGTSFLQGTWNCGIHHLRFRNFCFSILNWNRAEVLGGTWNATGLPAEWFY